jgi:hypothetical protein
MTNLGPKLLGLATIVASSAISSMITFGTYGYYKDKGHSSWKAGAASGATLGAIGGIILLAMSAMGTRASDLLVPTAPEMTGCVGCGFQGLQIQTMPTAIGLLTAQSLSGLTMEQVSGLTITQM